MSKGFEKFPKKGTEEEALFKQINKKKLPAHVAIIMDGNGRWAKKRGIDRIQGHRAGAESARLITECSARMGIQYLTLFVFSSENWKRPKSEVNQLMNMFYENLVEKKDLLTSNKIRLKVFGNIDQLPKKLRKKVEETEKFSENFKNMQINLALNYGSRMEIVTAIQNIIRDGLPEKQINEKTFQKYLYTSGCPDPDLLIRTSGEFRISNFLLFQIAYTELFFSDILWPDFREKNYLKVLLDYQNRLRRFGGL